MMPVGHHNQLPVFVQTHVAQGFLAVHFLFAQVFDRLCRASTYVAQPPNSQADNAITLKQILVCMVTLLFGFTKQRKFYAISGCLDN